jgi:hypothetical protein
MAFQLHELFDGDDRHALRAILHAENLRQRIDRLLDVDAPRYRRLWNYYRNPLLPLRTYAATEEDTAAYRPYRQAQEWGLPTRITGVVPGATEATLSTRQADGIARKEVVIENDIGWRVDTLVDYLFGKPIVIRSTVSDPERRDRIESILSSTFDHNGGITFLQQLALLGAVHGFVDVLVKLAPSTSPPHAGPARCDRSAAATDASSRPGDDGSNLPAPSIVPAPECDAARRVRFEIVEPARALPLLDPDDFRNVVAYAQVYLRERQTRTSTPTSLPVKSSWFDRFLRSIAGDSSRKPVDRENAQVVVTEIISSERWQRYEDERLVASGRNSLGQIPLVHIQNLSVPFEYCGAGDVEPLLPLQDELNTRLSDRAHRVTMQSFKMYLGKGIENFGELPVAPGRMWMTDNQDAQVVEFGGDAPCPSEDRAIIEVREALDKVSAVTPIAAGAIKGRIGRLTSAAALRVTMLALLAKTERKRTTYGAGIARMCELALTWLDHAGLFPTTPDERRIELSWPSPLPDSDEERLSVAKAKLQVGIAPDVVLRELGY